MDFIPTVLDLKNSRISDIADRFSGSSLNILVIAKLLSDIENGDKNYDFILIDCPPTSNIIIQSVFLASDYYLIPTIGDEISTDTYKDFKHIFNIKIPHLDNRSNPSNYGIPITLNNGDIHREYDQITEYIWNILQD